MLDQYINNFRCSGEVDVDVSLFLTSYGCQKTARHCIAVAGKAVELARHYHCDPSKAKEGGYLHDISVVIPTDHWIAVAHDQSIEVLPEEVQYPLILHQKLSMALAREVFKVTDSEILNAIGCHTTLRLNPSILDKVLFLADKIAWDQEGTPPYLKDLMNALDHSLDLAVLVYLDHLWDSRNELGVIHPWFVQAREQLIQMTK